MCQRGHFRRVTVTVAVLVFKQPLRADAMNCQGSGHTQTRTPECSRRSSLGDDVTQHRGFFALNR